MRRENVATYFREQANMEHPGVARRQYQRNTERVLQLRLENPAPLQGNRNTSPRFVVLDCRELPGTAQLILFPYRLLRGQTWSAQELLQRSSFILRTEIILGEHIPEQLWHISSPTISIATAVPDCPRSAQKYPGLTNTRQASDI